MAEKIFIADKGTQDLIKAKTDLIGSPNPSTADKTTLMNYLKQLEDKITNINGGTDWSKYIPYTQEGIVAYTGTNAYQTLVSIEGEGI